ncbi:hypothetical protein GALL_401290 [mine drainage metagenome]|uniref:Uncharacterized protein n=1 Tax=mine drainage metagenome TaxID=410659 RepID=A0A1J5QDT6_9ZZZZ
MERVIQMPPRMASRMAAVPEIRLSHNPRVKSAWLAAYKTLVLLFCIFARSCMVMRIARSKGIDFCRYSLVA